MAEIEELRREVSMALMKLEEKKWQLRREGWDLEKKADNIINGLTTSTFSWFALCSVIFSMQNKFAEADVSSIRCAFLMIAVGWVSAFVMACHRIRLLTRPMEHLKSKKAILIEDAKQLAVELHKSQKACQSKVTPVMEEDFPADNGQNAADTSNDIGWLPRQELFERRLEHVMDWGDFEGDYILYIKGITIFWMLLSTCVVMALYCFYDS